MGVVELDDDLAGNASQSLLRNRNRRMMSRSEQETRKYCCLSRSSRPAGVLSLGYSTLVRCSERIRASTASA
jgi:Tfp pilus assembly protein PilX